MAYLTVAVTRHPNKQLISPKKFPAVIWVIRMLSLFPANISTIPVLIKYIYKRWDNYFINLSSRNTRLTAFPKSPFFRIYSPLKKNTGLQDRANNFKNAASALWKIGTYLHEKYHQSILYLPCSSLTCSINFLWRFRAISAFSDTGRPSNMFCKSIPLSFCHKYS